MTTPTLTNYKQGVTTEETAVREGKTWRGGVLFWKQTCFYVGFEGVQRGFLSERKGLIDWLINWLIDCFSLSPPNHNDYLRTEERKGKDVPCRGAEDGKGSGTKSGKSGTDEESGGWENQKLSGEHGRVCKVEDSHMIQHCYISSFCECTDRFLVESHI